MSLTHGNLEQQFADYLFESQNRSNFSAAKKCN